MIDVTEHGSGPSFIEDPYESVTTNATTEPAEPIRIEWNTPSELRRLLEKHRRELEEARLDHPPRSAEYLELLEKVQKEEAKAFVRGLRQYYAEAWSSWIRASAFDVPPLVYAPLQANLEDEWRHPDPRPKRSIAERIAAPFWWIARLFIRSSSS